MHTYTSTSTTVPVRPLDGVDIPLMLQMIDDLNDTIRRELTRNRELQDELQCLYDEELAVYQYAVNGLDEDTGAEWDEAFRQAEIHFGFDPYQ